MSAPITYQVRLATVEMLTANQRLHWAMRSHRTTVLRRVGMSHTRSARPLDLPRHDPVFERAHLTVTIAWPDRRRRDPANWHPTVKALVDGAVDAGMIPDDDSTHLVGPDLRVSDELSGTRGAVLTFCWEVAS